MRFGTWPVVSGETASPELISGCVVAKCGVSKRVETATVVFKSATAGDLAML